MKLSDICIKRPVLAIVLSLVIILIGFSSYAYLGVRFFPNFQPRSIFISASFPGASAKLVESAVTNPLESALGTVPDIKTMTSESSRGLSSIKLKLKAGADMDEVTNDIRNQISAAQDKLPSTVNPPTVQVGWNENGLMNIAFVDPSKTPAQIRDYIQRYVVNQLLEVPGIANTLIKGADKYAMRIQLDPTKMAAYGLSIADIQNILENSNIEMPAGEIKNGAINFPVSASTKLKSVQQFKNLIVLNNHNQLVRLSDIASVNLGNESDTQTLMLLNGQPAVSLQLFTTANASPITVSKAVKTELNQIQSTLPAGMKMTIFFDGSSFLKSSIHEVYIAIGAAILFVLIAIYLFLGSLRAVAIPIITIPICIIGTFAIMYAFNFTINILTLLSMVLAIGLVVDDAIVMLENIHRHIELGKNPMDAAFIGSRQIAFAVIGMTLCLVAVYAPVGLIHNHIVVIFREFAFTLAGAVLISGFVALTLSPMMCSRWLTSINKENAYTLKVEAFFEWLRSSYQALLGKALNHRIMIIIITILLATGGGFIMKSLTAQFMPAEDIGFVFAVLSTPTGASFGYLEQQATEAGKIVSANNNVKLTSTVISDSPDSFNRVMAVLKPFKDRDQSANEIADSLSQQFKQIPGLNAFVFAPSPFSGSGHQDLQFVLVTSGTYQSLYQTTLKVGKQLDKNPGLNNVNSNMSFDSQQYEIHVNRGLAAALNVNVADIDSTLAAFLGGTVTTHFNLHNQAYDVILQAQPQFRKSLSDIKQFYVKSTTGKEIPLANLITINETLGEQTLPHYNHLRSAEISAQLSKGYTIGDAVSYLNKTLPTILPSNTKFAYKGRALRLQENNGSMAMVFYLSIIFIYLILAALFESFIDPLIVLLTVPLCIVGALGALKLFGGSLNIYTDIALVTLVGLVSKHGILITQFANELLAKGEDLKAAATKAAAIRLRPILMTTTTMICGALPLLFTGGASAQSRMQVGIVIIAGLIVGTFFSLFVVPVVYTYLGRFKRVKLNTDKS